MAQLIDDTYVLVFSQPFSDPDVWFYENLSEAVFAADLFSKDMEEHDTIVLSKKGDIPNAFGKVLSLIRYDITEDGPVWFGVVPEILALANTDAVPDMGD